MTKPKTLVHIIDLIAKEDLSMGICVAARELMFKDDNSLTREDYLLFRRVIIPNLPPRKFDWDGEQAEDGPLCWAPGDQKSRRDWLKAQIAHHQTKSKKLWNN